MTTQSLQPSSSMRYGLVRPFALLLALIAGVLGLLAPQTAAAAPFDAKYIPARAEGIIHLDLEKLQSSKLWPLVLSHLPEAVGKKGDAAKVSKDLINAWQTLDESGIEALALSMLGQARSLTVWSGSKDEFAVLVDLPLASVALAAALKAGVPLTKTSNSGVELYKFDEAVVAVHGSSIVVSTSADAVVATVKLLKGKGRSLPKEKLGTLGTSRSKGIVLVAGFGGKLMEAFKKEAASAALKTDIRSVVLVAGEDKGMFFTEAKASLGSAETAAKLSAVVSGLRAIVALSGDEPELKKLLNALSVTTKGSTLTARLELPIKALLELSKSL